LSEEEERELLNPYNGGGVVIGKNPSLSGKKK